MPEYRHPRALSDVSGRPPSAVSIGGESVPVDGDTFECDDDRGVRDLAEAYGVTVADLRVADDKAATCAGKDGDCSREVDEPGGLCWQHADE